MPGEKPETLVQKGVALGARVQKTRPVRVFMHYAQRNGAILSQGLSFQAIFAVFAAIWVAFSAAGFVIKANPELQDALFGLIGSSVPGLIDDGSGTGAIDPAVLLESGVLGWTGALALVGVLFTAVGWLASGRMSVRAMFDLPAPKANVVILKLKDLGLAIGFGIVLIVSAALSVFSTAAASTVLGFLGFDPESIIANIVTAVVGLALVLALDTLTLAAFYRVVSGLTIPIRRLLSGALIGGVALGVLKALGSSLLGGASSNPLLASFAVIIGLLIWFNLICQVILIGAAWIAVGMSDAGIIADPKLEAARLEEERRRREAEAAAGPKGLRRLFGRRRAVGTPG